MSPVTHATDGAAQTMVEDHGRGDAMPGANCPALAVESLGEPLHWATSARKDGFEIFVTSDLAMVATLWQTMQADATLSAFQTFGWLKTWQDEIGQPQGVKPVIVVIYDAHHGPLCLLPLGISTGFLRRLTWLGSQLCDYNAPVLASDFADRCTYPQFRALWTVTTELLRAMPDYRFDLCSFDKMPERVGALANPMLALPVMRNASSAHIAHLGSDWESFYAQKRSSSTRKKERKQLKQLADYGEIRFSTVTDPQDIADTLDILFAQKAASFARMGIENIFAREGYRSFFETLATDPSTAPLVHVARLDIGDIPAAASYALILNGVYYLIISSYTDHDLARHGPGRVHLADLMAYAMERRLTDFDFTIGDESYKRLWADMEMPIYDHAAGYSLSGMAASFGLRSFRYLKRMIKQNPRLWEAYTHLRVLIGG